MSGTKGTVRRNKKRTKEQKRDEAFEVLSRDSHDYLERELQEALKEPGKGPKVLAALKAYAAARKIRREALAETSARPRATEPVGKDVYARYDLSNLGDSPGGGEE